eukprot:tig00000179_g13067.t1
MVVASHAWRPGNVFAGLCGEVGCSAGSGEPPSPTSPRGVTGGHGAHEADGKEVDRGKAPRRCLATKAARKSAPPPGRQEAAQVPPRDGRLREIRKYQKTFNPLISYARFDRLVKELAQDEFKRRREAGFTCEDLRWQKEAIEALREAAEMHLIQTFEGANLMAIHRGRTTIQPRHAPSPALALARAGG